MTTKSATETAPASPTEELRQQAHQVREDLGNLGRAAKAVAQEKLETARRHTGEYVEQGKKRASEIEDQVEEYIRAQPIKSILIAAGAGALIGFLLGRK